MHSESLHSENHAHCCYSVSLPASAPQMLCFESEYLLASSQALACAQILPASGRGDAVLELHAARAFSPGESLALLDPATRREAAAVEVLAPLPALSAPATGLVLWLTGLSSSGKSTLGNAVAEQLRAEGFPVESLDGDEIRKRLCRDLGFSKADRDENVRRIGFAASLVARTGGIAVVAAISPYRALRDEIRTRIGRFVEIFVNTPLSTCRKRDVKGLYKAHAEGRLQGLTGVDDPYEAPLHPDLEIRTEEETLPHAVSRIMKEVRGRWPSSPSPDNRQISEE